MRFQMSSWYVHAGVDSYSFAMDHGVLIIDHLLPTGYGHAPSQMESAISFNTEQFLFFIAVSRPIREDL